MSVWLEIHHCRGCPHRYVQQTMGAGYAMDWFCKLTKNKVRKIAGYIEHIHEEPREIPKWCPLRRKKKKLAMEELDIIL